jgi:hypothetical protein
MQRQTLTCGENDWYADQELGETEYYTICESWTYQMHFSVEPGETLNDSTLVPGTPRRVDRNTVLNWALSKIRIR